MPIVLEDYKPIWLAWFEADKTDIERVLGDLFVAVDHIGSTSVPGLAAKPIVDISPGLRSSTDLDRCVEPLERLGYEYVQRFEASLPTRRYFRKRTPSALWSTNVHVYTVDDDERVRHLLFRDYLRTHPETVSEYAALKLELAPRFDDVNEYADAKTAYIRGIVARAYAEAAQSSGK